MQLFAKHRSIRGSRQARGGFTMVEIALSLAVVAFALVAIIGVLPTGMTVDKDNREDTLINQEGRYWLEAIKTGARGLQDLTNYVEQIDLYKVYGTNQLLVLSLVNTPATPLRSEDIIGLLTTPKYGFVPPTTNRPALFAHSDIAGVTNKVVARVKAITGPAAEKAALTNEYSFRYEIESEIIPDLPAPPTMGVINPAVGRFNNELGHNLHDVRIILRWPVIQRGNGWFVGNGRKQFRGKIVGMPVMVPNAALNTTNWFIIPNLFVNVGP